MERIIVIVGFLGAGKTTLLKKLVKQYLEINWKPQIILNDYENANLDAQQLLDCLDVSQVKAISGSCICCSGISELRESVNAIPKRENGVVLIEANGTTDACTLMEFLGVGLNSHFFPPIQIAVVDVRNWQKRGVNNELEANQVQVSSLVILNHTTMVSDDRIKMVETEILKLNPMALLETWDQVSLEIVAKLYPSSNNAEKLNHQETHWASCSIDLPDPLSSKRLKYIIDSLPVSLVRVKGCTKLDNDPYYSIFERVPSGETFVRMYRGDLITGPKLVVIGPGSDPDTLSDLINSSEEQH